jgi:hypothetical protein
MLTLITMLMLFPQQQLQMYFQETGWEGMDWTNLAQHNKWWAPINMALNLQVPYKREISYYMKNISFSRRSLPHGVSNNICRYK